MPSSNLGAALVIQPTLGTIDAAEALLQELYVDLRRRLRAWAALTKQTPQARMGYVGQHLVGVVTGLPGGRSGARGYDLIEPSGGYSEIKTCSRVDQLGNCADCGAAVAAIEDVCPACGSKLINRKDDSKWLIAIKDEAELRKALSAHHYYLVLFELVSQQSLAEALPDEATDQPLEVTGQAAPDISAQIWRVDPAERGFRSCLVDYYYNIRSKSSSKAPFNLWPYSLKFQLMQPQCIYQALITAADELTTLLFEGQLGEATTHPVARLTAFEGSHTNLPTVALRAWAQRERIMVPSSATRDAVLAALEAARLERDWTDQHVARELVELLYGQRLQPHQHWLT